MSAISLSFQMMYLIYSFLVTLGVLLTAPYYIWKRRDELAGGDGGNDSGCCRNHSSRRSAAPFGFTPYQLAKPWPW